jgi:hypothetical protein
LRLRNNGRVAHSDIATPLILSDNRGMRRCLKSKLFWILVTVVVACIAFIPLLQSRKWVGHTDLDIRFDVTDGVTGAAIKDAIVQVRAERGGFCEDREERQFDLATDDCGHAQYLCKNCMCFGSRGLFEDTFAIHLPWWWFQVTAPGYVSTKSAYLDVPERVREVKRGDTRATLNIEIALQRKSE